jgi:hypothetical protein
VSSRILLSVFALASALVCLVTGHSRGDDQLIQQALKSNSLLKSTYLDLVHFKSYSTAAQTKLNAKVPRTRTVNGHPLTGDIALVASDVGAPAGSGTSTGTNTGDVTIGTANGLSLAAQALSLGTATNSVPGAMSASDHALLLTAVQPSGNVATATALQNARTIDGVSFNGTSNIQTATANTSDYSTGTFTPTANSLTVVNGTGGATYTGNWTKIGRMVFITIRISVTGTATTAATSSTYFSYTGPPALTIPAVSMTANSATAAFYGGGPVGNGYMYVGTWSAVNNNIVISGWYAAS